MKKHTEISEGLSKCENSRMNNLKIWLSGSRGFIGSHLISALKDSCREVRCITNNKKHDDSLIYMDYSNINHIREIVNLYGVPNIFMHLGWGSVYEPQSNVHLTANVSDGKNLIKELYACGLEKFIFLGSSSEYGERTGALSENMSPEGKLTNYVKGKTEVSRYGFEIANQLNKVFVHIRLFYAYGAGQYPNSLINQLYKSYLEKSTMNLSPCEHYRDYIYISDVIQGIKLISHINESGIVNLGSGRVIQLKDFVSLFWKTLGGKPEHLRFGAHPKPGHEPEQPYSYANLDVLKKLTNWMPSVSLEEGIKETVAALNKSSASH